MHVRSMNRTRLLVLGIAALLAASTDVTAQSAPKRGSPPFNVDPGDADACQPDELHRCASRE